MRADSLKASLGRLTDPGSEVTASMLGDVERRGRTGAEHVLGDLLRRRGGAPDGDRFLLRAAYPGGVRRGQGGRGASGAGVGRHLTRPVDREAPERLLARLSDERL